MDFGKLLEEIGKRYGAARLPSHAHLSAHLAGPPASWPQSLRTVIRIMLTSRSSASAPLRLRGRQ
jgi:hypothetical protein